MTQWKKIEKNAPTGFRDQNGCMISLGDTIRYKRKVKAVTHWKGRMNSIVVRIPGHYKMIEVKVVGFSRTVRKHWKRGFENIEYIHVQEQKGRNLFRIYRTELVEVLNNSK